MAASRSFIGGKEQELMQLSFQELPFHLVLSEWPIASCTITRQQSSACVTCFGINTDHFLPQHKIFHLTLVYSVSNSGSVCVMCSWLEARSSNEPSQFLGLPSNRLWLPACKLARGLQALTLSNLDHWPRGPVDLRSYWPEGQYIWEVTGPLTRATDNSYDKTEVMGNHVTVFMVYYHISLLYKHTFQSYFCKDVN